MQPYDQPPPRDEWQPGGHQDRRSRIQQNPNYGEDLQQGRDAWAPTSAPGGSRRFGFNQQYANPSSAYRSNEADLNQLARLQQQQDTVLITHSRISQSKDRQQGSRDSRTGQRLEARSSTPPLAMHHSQAQSQSSQDNWNMSMPDAMEQMAMTRQAGPGHMAEYPQEHQHGRWQMEPGANQRASTVSPPPMPQQGYEYGPAPEANQYAMQAGQFAGPGQLADPQYEPPHSDYPPQSYPRMQQYASGQQEYPPTYREGSGPYNVQPTRQQMRTKLGVLPAPFPVVTVDASIGSLPVEPMTGEGKQPMGGKVESTHRMIPDIPLTKANRTEVRWFATVLVLFYLVSTVYYFFVRFAYTLGQGNYPAYGYFVLAVELMGVSAMIPYAIMQWRVTLSNKTPGLPAAPPMRDPIPNPWFHVRVMVPCYKEDMDVIRATVEAALTADLPPCTLRTVYLCDDGKSPEKEEFINKLRAQGHWAEYVTGRTRKPHEVNGKSGNLNNALRNIIYDAFKDPVKGKITKASAADIPLSELIVVFDADMVCKKNFFCKVLEAMVDDEIALCLTPQAFSNVTTWQDLFNNINIQFWQYILPGSNTLGYIACTGTNFCIRARPLATVAFFPEYTITEDYALGMELAKAGYKGTYLNEYLALGEAPTEARNVFRQRSRWTKGHMQVFFSHRCPVFNYKLSFANKWLYTNGTWAYFATIITTPTFIIVPFISLVFGIHPVAISRHFAIAATLYFFSQFLIQGYVRAWSDSTSLWWSGVSNHVLCFTYFKAVMNVLVSKVGLKRVGFKATDKGAKPNALQRLATTTRTAAENAVTMVTGKPKKKKAHDKGCCYFCCCCCFPCCDCCCPNLGDLQGTWDAHVLVFSFLFSMVAVGCGILRVYLDGIFQPFTVLPIFWALYNAIPPYLFLHYMFTKNCTFKAAAFVCRILSVVFGIFALGALWLSTNEPYVLKDVLAGTVTMMDVSRSGVLPTSIIEEHPWRGHSMKQDGSDLGLNLTGGFFVNGASNIKWNFPLAGSLALMAWGYLEFPQAYQTAGSADRFLANIRWGSDYLMAAHKDPWSFVAQVGDPEVDAQRWVPPEQDDSNRPSFLLTRDKGGADMFAAASAALTAASVAFNSLDEKYSLMAIEKAKSLYELAKQVENTTYCDYKRTGIHCYLEHDQACPGDSGRRLHHFNTNHPSRLDVHTLSDLHHAPGHHGLSHHRRHLLQEKSLAPPGDATQTTPTVPPKGSPSPPPTCKTSTYSMFYNSTSSYDDLAWAAAWLYKATGAQQYKEQVERYLDVHKKYEAQYGVQSYYVSNWNNMFWATNTLMFGMTKEDKYGKMVKSFVKTWVTGVSDLYRWNNGKEFWALNHTTKGLAFTPNQTLPQLSNALFLTHLYSKATPVGGLSDIIRCWVREQLNYMLGKKGSSERSYLVGFGEGYPQQPMSRSASCANPVNGKCNWEQSYNLLGPNPNVLTGALVNGPNSRDGFVDLRQLDFNRVGLDNNAGFMGLVAAEMQQAAPQAVCQERHGLYNTMFEEKQVQNKLKQTVKDKLRRFFGL